MRVSRSITLSVPAESVFGLVSDPNRYPEFFQGVTRWKPLTEETGLGARYRVLMQVGSIQAGGTVTVKEWDFPTTIAWESEAGVRQRGRWQVDERPEGTTLTLDIEYSLSGGPAGWLVEHMTARIIGRHAWSTLLAARRILERENDTTPQHV